MGTIILFYKYVSIDDTHGMMQWQRNLCESLGLKGRIILAQEGINGTLGGSTEHIELYKKAMLEHPFFADVDFKEAPGNQECFPRLRVVVKNEIVHFGVDPQAVSAQQGGTHLKPAQAHAMMQRNAPDLVIFDARNTYESRVGTFTNAITPEINHFRHLPNYIDNNLEQFKDKEVVMFCTGGIRCERASAYLKLKNVAKKVYQIEGGIHRYIEEFPDGFFRGKNYVFDGRVTVKVTNEVLGTCDICAVSCDDFSNCLNATCNKHFIGCASCIATYENACSKQCYDALISQQVHKRPLFKKIAPQTDEQQP